MSQANVEIIRRATDAFDRHDRAAWHAAVDPDAVMVPAHEWPETAPMRGAEAIWDFYAQVTATWEVDQGIEVRETIEAPGGVLVVNYVREARGAASGAPFEFNYWTVNAFRRGKLARIDWFADRDEAFEAAGLSE
jgi:ketosteroid isomerase-like protein